MLEDSKGNSDLNCGDANLENVAHPVPKRSDTENPHKDWWELGGHRERLRDEEMGIPRSFQI